MTHDFIPRAEAEEVLWLNNFKTNIAVQGPILGLTAAQITPLVTACTTLTAAINDVNLKKAAVAESLAQKNTQQVVQAKILRDAINKLKSSTTYTEAIGKSLGVIGATSGIDLSVYKAEIKGEIYAGFVRIKFTKKGIDGINIYHRKKGEVLWHFLARDTKSPYDDHIVLATPGQPEHWEYRAYGVIDDAEIGQASDIIEIVFGG